MTITNKPRVFFCYDYINDGYKADLIRNMDVVESYMFVSEEQWKRLESSSEKSMSKWIDEELKLVGCTVVLVGSRTAESKLIKYTILRSWEMGKGVLGVYIHNIKDKCCEKDIKGKNPFSAFKLCGTDFDNIVKCYDPLPNALDPRLRMQTAYDIIRSNLKYWVEEAISIRKRN